TGMRVTWCLARFRCGTLSPPRPPLFPYTTLFRSPAQGVSGAVSPQSAGTVTTFVRVPAAARYGIWVGGAFRRQLDVLLDGEKVMSRRDELSHTGQYEPLGDKTLSAGLHRISLRYGKADLRPGR